MKSLGIGDRFSPKIILDFCWNHGGSMDIVEMMLKSLPQCGRFFIKFQMGRKLPWGYPEHRDVQAMVESYGHRYLCTAFDKTSVEILEMLNVDAVKIGSAESCNFEFVNFCKRLGKPILVSTGGMDQPTVNALHKTLADVDHCLMQCKSMYPPEPKDLEIGVIPEWKHEFKVPIGYSSHWPGIDDALFAIAKGANVIEKHYSNFAGLDGGDHKISIGPDEVRRLALAAEAAPLMLSTHKTAADAEIELLETFR